jgi:hypothetical protein
MGIGNLMALDTAALRKERLAQTPGNGAAKELRCSTGRATQIMVI